MKWVAAMILLCTLVTCSLYVGSVSTTPEEEDMGLIVETIKREEGFSARAYNDSLGYPTIGYGKLIIKVLMPADLFMIEVTEAQASDWLVEEIADIEDRLSKGQHAGVWEDEVQGSLSRRTALIQMVYQLGYKGTMEFYDMWSHLYLGNFDGAAEAMLDSKWAKQTPARAARMAELMKGAQLTEVYGDL